MENKKIISTLVLIIAVLAIIASASGIYSSEGSGRYDYTSIRNHTVTIYGVGLYKHMSADVAIQGIAQDYVTLFIAIPALLFALFLTRKGTLIPKYLLAGILSYIFLTYLFYMNMAMYNSLFIVYVALTGTSFFALALTLLSIDIDKLPMSFNKTTPIKFMGGFLIFTSTSIALLWLSILIPPLLDNTIIPLSVEHYTTLTVQGFDLSLFHPIIFVAGLLLIKKNKFGYLLAPVTLIFLSFLMIALIAKIIAMSLANVNVIPAIFIIPCITIVAIVSSVVCLNNINNIPVPVRN